MDTTSLPIGAKVATGLQGLVGIVVLVFWAIWSTWGVFPNSHVVSGIFFFPALTLCGVAAFGPSKGRMYGWVMGLVGNGAAAAVLFFSAWPFGLLPSAILIYLLLPKVRGFYVRDYYGMKINQEEFREENLSQSQQRAGRLRRSASPPFSRHSTKPIPMRCARSLIGRHGSCLWRRFFRRSARTCA